MTCWGWIISGSLRAACILMMIARLPPRKKEIRYEASNTDDTKVTTLNDPTPNDLTQSIEKSFEENVKPLWAEWDKDVRVIRYGFGQ